MEFSASQIALIIKGSVEGNPNVTVNSFSKIEEAVAGQLAFLANPKYEDYLYSTGASIIIINESLELRQPLTATLIRVPDAYSAFATLLQAYEQIMEQKMVGIQEPSFVAKSAGIGENVFVGAFSYIGENVKLGKNVKVHPHCF
ncbi:MAG: UDP-3-O-(3-hydroxymyristoyl)glucosamine N-acyltransferase, partial [Lacibacter sp.]|nr:UDP-3-O-(3-hydroxymyristoyl)glucosamine N-acyltransferase [Lacibacter sp.]